MLQRHRSYASMSRNADALQMKMQNADADAKQMQNAECRCRMHCRCKLHCRIADAENTRLRSQTACAPEALGRIPVRYAKAAAPRQSAKVSWHVTGRSLSRCCKDLVLGCNDSGRILWGPREISVRTSVTVGKCCARIPP